MSLATLPRIQPNSANMIVFLGLMVALGPLATDMYLPSLPGIGERLQAPSGLVQLTLSAYMFGFAMSQLICGPLSDRFGRRPVILGGLFLFVIASWVCTQAVSIEQLIGARFFQALGGCVGPVLGRAMVRDLYDGPAAAKALSMVGMVMGLSPAAAPFFGGALQANFGWTSSFYALAAYGALIWAIVYFFTSETNQYKSATATHIRPMARNYWALLTNKTFVGYMSAQSWCFAGLFAFLSGAVFILDEVFHVAPVDFGYYFIWGVGAYMAGSFTSARIGTRLGLNTTLFVGGVLSALGGALAFTPAYLDFGTLYSMMTGMCIFFFALGIVMPQATTGAMMPFPHMAGSASALLGFVQMSGSAAVGVAVGQFHDGTALPMLGIIFGCGIMTLLSYIVLIAPNAVQESPLVP